MVERIRSTHKNREWLATLYRYVNIEWECWTPNSVCWVKSIDLKAYNYTDGLNRLEESYRQHYVISYNSTWAEPVEEEKD